MKVLKMYSSSVNDRYIDKVVETLREDGLIIYPTDSFYALGCNALSNRAIEQVCRLKGVDARKETLSIVCSDLSMASGFGRIDNAAYKFMRPLLPGPFTFILPSATSLPKVFKGRRTVGIRVPDNEIARAITRALGNPILSTSITTLDGDEVIADPMAIADHYEHSNVDIMIEAEEGQSVGTTVVDLTDSHDPQIVRQGLGEL